MDASAIREIAEMTKPNFTEIGGYVYSDKNMMVVRTPTCQSVRIHTLNGLVSLVKSECGKLNSPLFVSVCNYNDVDTFTTLKNEDKTRDNLCSAVSETPEFAFGHWYSYEEMIIALRTKFERTSELDGLVSLLGSICKDEETQTMDDGITQRTVVRKGINLRDNKVIDPIITLKPFRTFLEVEQPESDFLFRLSTNGDKAALFEADGGAWKLTARKNIAEYLKNELSELIKDGKVIVIE